MRARAHTHTHTLTHTHTTGAVKPLVDITRLAQKEKVFRVALSALRNLLDFDDIHNDVASDMVEAGLPKIVVTRQLQVGRHKHMHCSLVFSYTSTPTCMQSQRCGIRHGGWGVS